MKHITVWASIRLLMIGQPVSCHSDSCGGNPSLGAQNSGTERPEREQRLRDVYALVGQGAADENDVEEFVKTYEPQIHCDRIVIKGVDTIIIKDEKGIDSYELSLEDFRRVFYLVFTSIRLLSDVFEKYLGFSFEQIMRLLCAALCLPVDPFNDGSNVMRSFMMNTVAVLEQVTDYTSVESMQRPEDIPGVTDKSAHALLSLCASKARYYCGGTVFSFPKVTEKSGLIVYNGGIFRRPSATLAFLHLLRLCGVTELNIRPCTMDEPIPEEARRLLGRCGITDIIVPLDLQTCKNLYLTTDSDEDGQRETWPKLRSIRLFSQDCEHDDALFGHEFDMMIEMGEAEFIRGLRQPIAKFEDLKRLRCLQLVSNAPIEKYLPYIEQANNLRALELSVKIAGPLPECIANMENMEILAVRSAEVTEIPAGILSKLSKLKWIDFSHNKLKSLPDEPGVFEHMHCIDVSDNQLSALPVFVTDCPNLNSLDVSKNCLAGLPDGMEKLSRLEDLDISENRNPGLLITASKCANLLRLAAANNKISSLPDELFGLTKLRSLELRDNCLTELPSQIEEMTELTHVDITHNHLSTISASIGSLAKLKCLLLTNNRLERLPKAIREMEKKNKGLFLWLGKNPLQYYDSGEELGIKSLWNPFGEYTMMAEYAYEYVTGMLEEGKPQFYRGLQSQQFHWNMEAVRTMVARVPPVHKIGTRDEIAALWERAIILSPWDELAGGPIQRERMIELLDRNYCQADNEEAEGGFMDEYKPTMRDYLEAILNDIVSKLERGGNGEDGGHAGKNENRMGSSKRRRDREDAIEMLRRLNESLEFCNSRWMADLMSIYSLYCERGEKEGACESTFVRYVGDFIARTKENTFTATVAAPGHAQSAYLVLFWKRQLKDELGLRLECGDSPGTRDQDWAWSSYDPIRVLEAFFAVFTPEYVAALLTKDINEEGKVGEASKYLHDAYLLPVELREEYFELADGVEDAAENYCFTSIKEAGVRKILVAMGILLHNH